MRFKNPFSYSVAGLMLLATVCMCTPESLPVADVLDVQFNEDGTATNVAPSGVAFMRRQVPTMDMPFRTGGRLVAPFSNAWGCKAPSTSYYYDYKGQPELVEAIAGGHSFEVLVRPHFDGQLPDVEVKILSSLSGGGCGIVVSGATADRGNEFAFIPFTESGDDKGYRWALSGVTPESDVDYHVVGVWDKENASARVYVNGRLCGTVDAPGDLVMPSWDVFHQMSLGAGTHPHFQGGVDAFAGTISVARIYGRALSDEEVSSLYRSEKKFLRHYKEPKFMGTTMFRGLAAKPGVTFPVYGTCFREGDRLSFVPVSGDAEPFTLDAAVEPDRVVVTLPDALSDAEYEVFALRGAYSQLIGKTRFTIVDRMPKPTCVIAHQGDFNRIEAGQNTASSFMYAVKAGYYGSETDAQITADGVIVINHDSMLKGVDINTSPYEAVKDLVVDDFHHEKIATLQQLLDILVENPDSPTKLVLEIKRQARAPECVDSAVALVRRMGLQDRVDYISFDKPACREIAALNVEGVSAYLDHDLNPYEVKELGMSCMDKAYPYMRDEWYDLSHELGLTVNIWTPDVADEMIGMVNKGADFITTNSPVRLNLIRRHYVDNEGK